MSNAVRYLGTLYSNPFIFGPVFHSFYKSLSKKDNSVLLSYLVLPLVLYPASQKYLTKRKNPHSCLRILAKTHEHVFGLQERIREYCQITNTTIQHAINLGVLDISRNLSIEILSDWPNGAISPPNSITAAERLGQFMSFIDVPTAYRMLGVKRL